ncbi:MAG: TonB-dependent receptor [Ignavibacteriaceae bacterium]|nr:TonB-dependent receptor [Ignavibacteriaceae bacterium]
MPGVTIALANTKYGAISSSDGSFRIQGIPAGRYELRVSFVGYETKVYPDIVVSTGHRTDMLFELTESVLRYSEGIVVKGGYYREDPSMSVSSHGLDYEEIRRNPGGVEDISRVILSLPGVLTSSDDRNDLIVRGGNPTENLNLVDNIEVPNINHFGTQGASGGPIGILNTDFIREVNFSSGGFPVKYGDRLSSVMDIKLREGSRERIQGDINLNMAGFGAVLEAPLTEKGSIMLSAKKSFLDIIAKLNVSSSITAIPNYSNYALKAVYDLDESNQVSVVALGGIDEITFQENEYEIESMFKEYKLGSDQTAVAGGINYRRLWSRKSYSLVTISDNYNSYYSDVFNPGTGAYFYKNSSYENEAHIKADFVYKFSAASELTAGAGAKLINYRHDVFYEGDTSFVIRNSMVDTIVFDPLNYAGKVKTNKYFTFFQYTHWFGEKLKATTGVRYDNFAYIKNSSAFSYRGGLSWYFTPVTNLNLFYGTFYQTPPYIWLSSDSTSRELENIRADHIVIGVEHFFTEDIKFTVEAYYKKYSQVPVSKSIPEFTSANAGGAYGAYIIRNLSSNGSGVSRGVEITLQKKLLDGYYGIVSYGLSDVRFTALDGISRPGSFDFGNIFTIVLGYIPNSVFECSFKWRYAGGRPYTPFNEPLSKLYGKGVEDYSRTNALRHPPYHRLDLRADYRITFDNWNIVTYFELQNAYFRLNLYETQWDMQENREKNIYQWRFFPVGGFSIEF